MGSIELSPAAPLRCEQKYISSKVQDLMSLENHVVVITGGARGIGLALAFAVAEAGASVAIVDASPQPDENFDLLKTYGVKARYYRSAFSILHQYLC